MTTTWVNLNTNNAAWTPVPRPVTSTVGIVSGTPIGLLMALTYAATQSNPIDPWTDVTRPTTLYTNVPKAT